jgi:hypothetical protein
MDVLAGRVIAETDPGLDAPARVRLWRQYGLRCGFEWVAADSEFRYHELEVRPWTAVELAVDALYAAVGIDDVPLPPRELPALLDALNDDPRLHWASPDALLLEWAASEGAGTVTQTGSAAAGNAPAPVQSERIVPGDTSRSAALAGGDTYGPNARASFIDDRYRALTGGLDQWLALGGSPDPLPDFEYYRECLPTGTAVDWAEPLAASPQFMQRASVVYGTGQAAALRGYRAAGTPALSSVTVCVADTGVLLTHPDLAPRLHPNAIDANYRNFVVSAPRDRVDAKTELKKRDSAPGTGFPRQAIEDRPPSHGTCVAGIVARCTDGFAGSNGRNAVRILPASVRSEKAYVITGTRIKSPISAFVKLIACLNSSYPVGEATLDKKGRIFNDGDVRVVSISASIPRAYFSGQQWRLVAPLISKAAGSIAEDLRSNDRLYLFASGNEAQAEPNRPGDEPYVMCVSACMPFDPARPWLSPASKEGANMGLKCVSAPGYGIITSTLYDCPNLAYLGADHIPPPKPDHSVPKRGQGWSLQTNSFSATSAATPQVGALAALLYAQDFERTHMGVMSAIVDSTAARRVVASYGEAGGLIDYPAALGW